MSNPNIPEKCNACGAVLRIENLYVDDGCTCNSARGVNFEARTCALCKTDCVKPGHRLAELFGADVVPTARRETLIEAIDLLDHVDASTLVGNSAEIRATLVEMLRDLGRIAPPWNPIQYNP